MTQPRTVPWYRHPVSLGLVGLLAMVIGYKASTYIPPMTDSDSRAEQLRELRGMAKEDARLSNRLDEITRNLHGNPPYQEAGRFIFFAGLLAFIAAGVMMATAPAGPGPDESPDPVEGSMVE